MGTGEGRFAVPGGALDGAHVFLGGVRAPGGVPVQKGARPAPPHDHHGHHGQPGSMAAYGQHGSMANTDRGAPSTGLTPRVRASGARFAFSG